jgi:multiple sugar transport system substrate-binding protein
MFRKRAGSMKSFLRQHWGALFLSLIALSFVGAQAFLSAHRGKAVKEIYFADRLTEAHRILIEEYNHLHEGHVKVIPIDFPNADFTTNERKEILARFLRGEGDAIDVFAVDPIWVQRFARWSEPLDQYFTSKELAGIRDEGLQSCYKDGKLVAVPVAIVRGVLLYREDILHSIPGGDHFIERVKKGITWDEFIQHGQKFHGPGPYYLFPAAAYEGLICVFNELLLGIEPDYFRNHGFNFETTPATRALKLLVDLVQTYHITPPEVTGMTEVTSYEYFLRTNACFLRGWTSYDRDFAEMKTGMMRIRQAPLPHFADGTPATTIGGWNLMVSRFSAEKAEAVAFVKFLLEKGSQEIIYSKAGYFPPVRALYEEEVYKRKYPELAEVDAASPSGAHRPSHPNYTKYSEILGQYISQAIRGHITVEDALHQATGDIRAEKVILTRK